MGVDYRLMPVPMRMRLCDRPIMLVLVMLIMGMAVFMFECVVLVFMFMPFSKMHPKSKAHQCTGKDQSDAQRVMQQDNCDRVTHAKLKQPNREHKKRAAPT